MEMSPAQAHNNTDVLSRAGVLPIKTVGAPGVHGEKVIGTQGWGDSIPSIADVAAATAGLARDTHMPNGMIFTPGMWSMMVAACKPPDTTRFVGKTPRAEGATPKEHVSMAPWHT